MFVDDFFFVKKPLRDGSTIQQILPEADDKLSLMVANVDD